MAQLFRNVTTLTALSGKTVLVRIDSDVAIRENGTIGDITRVERSLKTVEYLISQDAHVILIGHVGRPEGEVNEKYTLLPIATYLKERYQGVTEKEQYGNFPGWKITDKLSLLENIRFFRGEEANDTSFAQDLAVLGEFYVNECFATSHRKHASIVGIPEFLVSYAGTHLEDEVVTLSQVLENPKRPLVVIIGGAKLETKLPLVHKMHNLADYELVGGKIAGEMKEDIKEEHNKAEGEAKLIVATLRADSKDITEESTQAFVDAIKKASMIVWNGPMGYTEGGEEFCKGTKALAEAIVSSSAFSIVGGGDTIAYLDTLGIINKFSFVSMGGGAMLSFLSGEKLPGLEALVANASRV